MKNLLFLIILSLFNISCAGIFQTQDVLEDDLAQEEELAESDTSCSYFYFLWGSASERDKQYAEAQEAYEKALVCDPGTSFVKKRLALLLARMGKPNQAIMWMQNVVDQDPDDFEARFWMARIYSLMERNQEALSIYIGILQDDPKNLDAMYHLGSLYLSNRQYENALDILKKLVVLDPESAAAHMTLARLYREMHYVEQAASSYKLALEYGWNVPLALEAAEVLEKTDSAAAITLYAQILEDDETNDIARQRLTGLYLLNGEIDQAVKLLEDLRQYSSEKSRIDFTIGRILLENERIDEAIAEFLMALKEDPDFHAASYLLALSYLQKEDPIRAREILQAIPADFQAYEDVVVLLLRTYKVEGNYPAMENLLAEKIADSATRRVRYYNLLASVYHQQEKESLAEEVYKQGLADFPTNTDLLFEYAVFLENTGDHDGAMLKMGEIIDIDPNHAMALNYIGYSWADSGINLHNALEYIQKAVSLRPEDGYIRDSLGWVFFRLGQFERAVEELKKAIEKAPKDPTIHEHLGDAYLAVDNADEALRVYRQAVSLYHDEAKKIAVGNKIKALEP